ncbi:aspartate/glutamate racemase family protein [Nguyenibacter vanlangensis]|uniref:Aspartate/glutamate racemase family protein n=1 Tax=Nguyenibacter vanlangensis TaxID=1216886 RepID=A0A7Y7IYQ0_9PROT|nr:aspartate/glutamate racemase family protein [Nguyenibacter vanlangensis]NVN12582.1 aspartate/glutamate racemase family protein [Nguyenibacter vanlangensis]
MKTIGLLGGLSWESSAVYYRLINQGVQQRLGGVHSARCLLWSFDFAEIEHLQRAGRWADATALMIDAARRLEAGGADIVLICTNTMHRMADAVQAALAVPLLHIADPVAARLRADGRRRVALLGTLFTMEQDFYRGRLARMHGLEVLTPDATDRQALHRIIYDELVRGTILPESRQVVCAIIRRLADQEAEAVILGCTEIMLLVGPDDSALPLYDTTALHAEAAVRLCLE